VSLNPRRSVLDWILEGLSLATLLAIVGVVAINWDKLPARIPRHFGISGQPDRWGGKSGMLNLPVIAFGLYAMLTLASRYQGLINVPMAIDRNAPEVRRLLLRMSLTLKLTMLMVFGYLTWSTVNVALGLATGLGRQFLGISLGLIFVPVIGFLYALRAWRK